jgi:hypothetical protein
MTQLFVHKRSWLGQLGFVLDPGHTAMACVAALDSLTGATGQRISHTCTHSSYSYIPTPTRSLTDP